MLTHPYEHKLPPAQQRIFFLWPSKQYMEDNLGSKLIYSFSIKQNMLFSE